MGLLAPKKPLPPPSSHPVLLQYKNLKAVDSNNEDVGVAVDMHHLNRTAYKQINIWVIIDPIQDVQHPLCDVDQAHASELEDIC